MRLKHTEVVVLCRDHVQSMGLKAGREIACVHQQTGRAIRRYIEALPVWECGIRCGAASINLAAYEA